MFVGPEFVMTYVQLPLGKVRLYVPEILVLFLISCKAFSLQARAKALALLPYSNEETAFKNILLLAKRDKAKNNPIADTTETRTKAMNP